MQSRALLRRLLQALESTDRRYPQRSMQTSGLLQPQLPHQTLTTGAAMGKAGKNTYSKQALKAWWSAGGAVLGVSLAAGILLQQTDLEKATSATNTCTQHELEVLATWHAQLRQRVGLVEVFSAEDTLVDKPHSSLPTDIRHRDHLVSRFTLTSIAWALGVALTSSGLYCSSSVTSETAC